MKKLLLILTVLACGVGEMKAWGDLYLICSENNSWAKGADNGSNDSYKQDAFKFTCTSENHFRATVPGSYITSGSWSFRFRDSSSDSWKSISPELSTGTQEITSTVYSTNYQNHDGSCFVINQNASARFVHIYCNWNTTTNKWDITSEVITSTTNYAVAYTNPTSFSKVYAYAFLDGVTLKGAWPGTEITGVNGIYSTTVTGASGTKIIFNNGSSGDGNQSWTFDIEDAAVYKYDGKVANQNISLSNELGTYSSDYPLTFPEGDVNIMAYKAEVEGAKVKLTRVTGVVPAKTGLVIKRKSDSDNSMDAVPSAASPVDMTGNLMKPGTGAGVVSEAGFDRYVLAKNKTTGDIHFAKLISTSRVVPVGMAYLEVASGGAPSLSIVFDGEDDVTTGIDAIEHGTLNIEHYYNLAGQRVSKPTKGLYIVNGKKVVIK